MGAARSFHLDFHKSALGALRENGQDVGAFEAIASQRWGSAAPGKLCSDMMFADGLRLFGVRHRPEVIPDGAFDGDQTASDSPPKYDQWFGQMPLEGSSIQHSGQTSAGFRMAALRVKPLRPSRFTGSGMSSPLPSGWRK